MQRRARRRGLWGWLVATCALVGLLAGCGGGGGLNLGGQGASGSPAHNAVEASSGPSTRPHASTRQPTRTPSSHATAGVDGTWTGSYVCGQGATGLDLTVAGSSAALAAVFHFHPLPSNPSAADGVFTMTGSASGRTVVLHQQRWVSQPSGYLMVDLSGTLSPDGNTFSGTVVGAQCRTFSLHRS